MIRGLDFYQHSLQLIQQQPNFTIRFDNVDHVFSSEYTTGIMVKGKPLHCDYVFNSILFNQPVLREKHYWLLQHFKGFTVETEDNCFRPEQATLMDFRTSQEHGTAFYYVLPFSPRHALVEYTFFSAELLKKEVYDQGLRDYLEKILGIRNYKITESEFGVIPMTNFRFSPGQNRIINLGTAGGQTKGSSGYTFNFIQKHSRALVNQLIKTGQPFIHKTGGRFSFYDSLLLQILHRNILTGEKIFSELFSKNPPHRVLKFLDNETTPSEELGIITSLPAMPFLKAAINQLI
jgi:lycopene beta-cyclase